jgi:molybdopterin-guanine dinucleotide biosynthesis protein A
VAGALEALISQKDYAVHNILSKTHSRILKISEEFEWWDPELFLNINREEDLQRLPSSISLKRHEK